MKPALLLILSSSSLLIACDLQGQQKDAESKNTVIALPLNFDRYTGDLDTMAKKRNIRAIVLLDPIGFFYSDGAPHGAMYEALMAFQRFTNEELKTRSKKIEITFLPLRPDQVEVALLTGLGDIVAHQIFITPERERVVAFSTPIRHDVTQIIVTGPRDAAITSFEGLGGKAVYVNPLTTFYANLQKVNESLQRSGKEPMVIRAADKNLSEDDLIQMVNAGAIPATAATRIRAELWSKVLNGVRPHPELVIASGGKTGWAMRKDSPQLKRLVDKFAHLHAEGTPFGSVMVQRYLKNTRWVRDSTSPQEIAKFHALVDLFKKYAQEYDFDYLMLAAEGFQESRLNQNERSPGGAVGIMQVLPQYATAPPISVPNVLEAEGNIHAGAKMLRTMAEQYFNDPDIDPLNRSLMLFASYNAGPNRIANLRRNAKDQGLDPNVWFGNVELLAAQDVGQSVVLYVANVYKYYVAYKLALEQSALR
jgi:membrane-bound lytic murein transglycosylase MltF